MNNNVNYFNVLIGLIFRAVWQESERYNGKIPLHVLQQLDRDGDWPTGTAQQAAVRIRSDANLRRQLEAL